MKIALTQREVRALLLGGFFAILTLWVYGAYLVRPLWGEVTKLGLEVRDARSQLSGLRQATTNETNLREQHRQLQEAVTTLRSLLPVEAELPTVIDVLSGLARQTQVKIQAISPLRPLGDLNVLEADQSTDTPSVYKEIPIQIDAQANYHQLGTFLNLLESSGKPMYVSTLRISSNPKDVRWHNINLVVLAQFVTGEEAPSAQ